MEMQWIWLFLSHIFSALIVFSSFIFQEAIHVHIPQARSALNSLICGCRVFGTSEMIVFRGHHRQIARYSHMLMPCHSSEWQHMRVIRREIDFCVHLVCPSLLCFRAQFGEPCDVSMHAAWITLLTDASAQRKHILQMFQNHRDSRFSRKPTHWASVSSAFICFPAEDNQGCQIWWTVSSQNRTENKNIYLYVWQ